MNKETAKQYLPFVQALIDGKTIQERQAGDSEWVDLETVVFAGLPQHYRIKPEPREFWIHRTHSDHSGCRAYEHRIYANLNTLEIIRVREVV